VPRILNSPSDSLAYVPARAFADSIQRRELSSVEAIDDYLERIDRHNPSLTAVVSLDADRARQRAAAADAALARGDVWVRCTASQ
jgi:amidase